MRIYDLHVRLDASQERQKLQSICKVARLLGYTGIAVESPKNLPERSEEDDFFIIQRTTLSTRSAARLRIRAEKIRKRVDLLVIHGRTKPIWLTAANVAAIDMVLLQDLDDFGVVDAQTARAVAAKQKPVEICLRGLLTQNGPVRSRLMRAMASALKYLLRAKCQIVLTSGATDACGLRSPQDLAALAYLADIPEEVAKQGILNHPTILLSRLTSYSTGQGSNPFRRR